VQHGSRATLGMWKDQTEVTLVVEEELLLAARKVALDQRTSVESTGAGVSGKRWWKSPAKAASASEVEKGVRDGPS